MLVTTHVEYWSKIDLSIYLESNSFNEHVPLIHIAQKMIQIIEILQSKLFTKISCILKHSI